MDGAVMLAEEVPPKDEVMDEVLDDSAVSSHEPAFDAELDVDSAYGFHLTAVYAYGFPFVWLDLIFEEGGMSSKEIFTNARFLASCVA